MILELPGSKRVFSLSDDDFENLSRFLDINGRITLGHTQFQGLKHDKFLKRFSGEESILEFSPEFREWIERSRSVIGDRKSDLLIRKMSDLVITAGRTRYITHIIDFFIQKDGDHLIELSHDLFSIHSIDHSIDIDIPNSLLYLASITSSTAGVGRGGTVGKGEFLIPFLFEEGRWEGPESIVDVSIGGRFWHVKSLPVLRTGAPVGMHVYAGSDIQKFFETLGMSSTNISTSPSLDFKRSGKKSHTSICDNLDGIRSAMQDVVDCRRTENCEWIIDGFLKHGNDDFIVTDSIVASIIQDGLDSLVKKYIDGCLKGITRAAGACFYIEKLKKILFRESDACHCCSVTQSTVKITPVPDIISGIIRNFSGGMSDDVESLHDLPDFGDVIFNDCPG